MKPTKPSEIYRRAAEWMRSYTGACGALVNCPGPRPRAPYIVKFEEYFKPANLGWGGYWFGALTEKNKNVRILALLLMSEIAKDEELQ